MYTARAEQVGPFRILVAYLPWPEWDKNDRLAPNCIRRESKADGGRLYFVPAQPMWKNSAAAKAYRSQVIALVAPVLPVTPWYDASLPWMAQLLQYRPAARADVDHHSGVLDDMIVAGLAADDRRLRPYHLDAEEAAPDEEGGLYWYSRQLLAA